MTTILETIIPVKGLVKPVNTGFETKLCERVIITSKALREDLGSGEVYIELQEILFPVPNCRLRRRRFPKEF